jgi:hypothetical protein
VSTEAAADCLLEKEAGIRKALFGGALGADDLAKARKYVTESGFVQPSQHRGMLAGLLIGDKNPLQIIKSRYAQGGILGKGGILRGDLAFDPSIKGNWADAMNKDRGTKERLNSLWEASVPAAMGAVNVGMGGVLPAAMLASAASAGDWREGLTGVGEMGGYALGGPLGGVASMAMGMGGGMLGYLAPDAMQKAAPAAQQVARYPQELARGGRPEAGFAPTFV